MRIGVRFGGVAGPEDAVLVEGGGTAGAAAVVERFRLVVDPMHGVGCACCAPRGPAAVALGRLFLARARGEVGWFSRVVVMASDAGAAAVRAALAEDAVVMARFVEAETSPG